MWKILLGVYIVVIVLSAILLWSSLVLSKRADYKEEMHSRPGAGFKFGGKDNSTDNEVVELPATSELRNAD